MDYTSFLNEHKVLLVAPAGYGKTYTIAQCLKHTAGKGLILTHTHAGVASIKEKLRNKLVDSKKYNVETISSFAQKYVIAFYTGKDIPDQEDSKKYHPFIIEKAIEIFFSSLIAGIIKSTYSGLFVDEYQDCSKEHHKFLQSIGLHLPTRIFGDPLQGIFDFNGELIDFSTDLVDFNTFPELSVPYRWNLVGKKDLGASLKLIRESLEKGEGIDLNKYKNSIELVIAAEMDIYDFKSTYFQKLNSIRGEESLLIIHPDSTNKNSRINFSKRFKGITSIESIDDSDFYKIAKTVDEISEDNPVLDVKNIAYLLFDKTGLNNWFNNKGFKNKTSEQDKKLVLEIKKLLDSNISIIGIEEVLMMISKLPHVSCSRIELFKSLLKAIKIASEKNLTVYKGMKEQRNLIRRIGRRVEGKHIGTTLLTKGLEFDVVAVLDAHKFKCPKNLYVALTRCRKRLIVFSNNPILSPYQ